MNFLALSTLQPRKLGIESAAARRSEKLFLPDPLVGVRQINALLCNLPKVARALYSPKPAVQTGLLAIFCWLV